MRTRTIRPALVLLILLSLLGQTIFAAPTARAAPIVTEYTNGVEASPYLGTSILGSDGAIWFHLGVGLQRYLARVAADGNVTRYPISSSVRAFRATIVGPDGAFWLSDWSKIERMTTSGVVTTYAVENAFSLSGDRTGRSGSARVARSGGSPATGPSRPIR